MAQISTKIPNAFIAGIIYWLLLILVVGICVAGETVPLPFDPIIETVSSYKMIFKQKTAYEIIAGDWSSDVCSSDLVWQEQGYWRY